MVPLLILHEVGCLTSFTGAEPFLFSLLERLELDLAMATSSLHCLQLDPGLRSRLADSLVPITKLKVRFNLK
jgi:hypothetical protein